MVSVQSALDGAQNRQRPDTEQQDSGGQSPAKLPHGKFLRQLLKPSVDVDPCPDQATQRQAHNKEHRITALWHILNHRVDAKPRSRQSHGRIQRILLIFPDSLLKNTSDQASCQNRAGIYDRSRHLSFLIFRFSVKQFPPVQGENDMIFYSIASFFLLSICFIGTFQRHLSYICSCPARRRGCKSQRKRSVLPKNHRTHIAIFSLFRYTDNRKSNM